MNTNNSIIVYRSMREQALDQFLFNSDVGSSLIIWIFCILFAIAVTASFQNRIKYLSDYTTNVGVKFCITAGILSFIFYKLTIFALTYL